MLETFTVETFSPYVGDKFRAFYDESGALELTLSSATEFGTESAKEWSKTGGRVPFTLIFTGPIESVLEQRIYRLEHDKLDAFEIFLVPLGPNNQGMRYEAIFT